MSIKWISTPFGLLLDYEVPTGCDVVALGIQMHQIVPVTVCLPHQVYREKIIDLMVEHSATEIHIIPYSSQAMRDRCRELSNAEQDDYDRAVVCIIDHLESLLRALQEITEGKGTFSTDRYQHACNTIEDMKQIARDSLAPVGGARE